MGYHHYRLNGKKEDERRKTKDERCVEMKEKKGLKVKEELKVKVDEKGK